MGDLVSDLIKKARNILNDRYADNFTRDDISDLCNGSVTVFQAYNQNILTVADGAPAAPVVRINGVTSAVASYVSASGLVTLSVAPAAGALVYLEYYFALMLDDTYLDFSQQAAKFVGLTPTFTLVSQDREMSGPLAEAAVHYMAHLGASKRASLSSWYYRAGAGNKNFDKAVIAQAFKDAMKEEYSTALSVRDDYYTREGARNAPAWGRGHTPITDYTPPR